MMSSCLLSPAFRPSVPRVESARLKRADQHQTAILPRDSDPALFAHLPAVPALSSNYPVWDKSQRLFHKKNLPAQRPASNIDPRVVFPHCKAISGVSTGPRRMIGKYLVIVIFAAVIVALGWGVYRLRDRFAILREFLTFLGERKLWWLAPILVVFAAAGLFVAVTSNSAVSAFIYTLF